MSLLTRYRTPSSSTQVLGEGHDLSKDGLFIASEQPESLGTLLEVEWEGRTGRTLRALARVAWVRIETRAGKPAGMGVEFVKTGPDGRPAVESVAPPGGSSSPPPPSIPPAPSIGDLGPAGSAIGADSDEPPIAGESVGPEGPVADPAREPDPSPGTASAVPALKAAKAALGELRDRISRARRSVAPSSSSEPPAPDEAREPDTSQAGVADVADASDAKTASEPMERPVAITGSAEDVAPEIRSKSEAEGLAAAAADPGNPPPAAVAEPSAPPASPAMADPDESPRAQTEENPPFDAIPPTDAAMGAVPDAAQAGESRQEIAAADPLPDSPPAAPADPAASPSTPPAASDRADSASTPTPLAGDEAEGTRPDEPPAEPRLADALEPRASAETTEPGLADAVVARMLDAAQSVQESFRPFALKGDVPTASFRWKPLVARVVSLAVLAGAVTFSWFHGARLLERILPPELLPVAEPAPERPAGRLAPAVPQPAPAPGETAPAAAPAIAAEGVEYALDVRTVPPRASAIVGTDTIITPGVISLGAFAQPVELRIEKLGYQPEVAVIDRSGFAPASGRMLRVVSLTLKTAAAATASPLDMPPPAAPEPPSAQPAPPTPAPPVAAAPGSKATAASPGKPGATKPMPTKPTPTKPTPTKPAATKKSKDGAKAETPAPAPAPGVSPLQAAQACLARGDNACAVDALAGKARTPRELELLVETHRAMGNQVKAWEVMRTYLDRFPDEKRAEGYRRTLGQ